MARAVQARALTPQPTPPRGVLAHARTNPHTHPPQGSPGLPLASLRKPRKPPKPPHTPVQSLLQPVTTQPRQPITPATHHYTTTHTPSSNLSFLSWQGCQGGARGCEREYGHFCGDQLVVLTWRLSQGRRLGRCPGRCQGLLQAVIGVTAPRLWG